VAALAVVEDLEVLEERVGQLDPGSPHAQRVGDQRGSAERATASLPVTAGAPA
jgi:hypothetical protein